MAQKILTISFYFLFFATPLIWFPFNFELFEYNKMMLIYLLTIITTTCWLLKMIGAKELIVKRTPLDIPLLLFLGANILSTIFSLDPHTSLWGYYSRSNGGLFSLISYLLLFYALVSNFDQEQALKFLKAAIFGGVVVSLWAIPEHFGVSPSCIILTGEFNASCWVQDVQARVFATLGQPNWLGAYLGMLIFPTIYFTFIASSRLSSILHTTYSLLLYLAFTFTYSRGATLGFLGGLGVFLLLTTISKLRLNPQGLSFKKIFLLLISFLLINLFFGSALTNFKLVSKFAAPQRPLVALPATLKPTTTQLESGGTESGSIRLIVWKGALEIFKHYPILGSGVETFAYSYYNFRPIEHNLVSEWDFLYNKAHNEFLNYLATTGIVGFLSYCLIFITFIIIILRKPGNNSLLIYSLLATYISYLVQNFFGFSIVIIALFFYLFPGIAFIITNHTKPLKIPAFHLPFLSLLTRQKFSKIIVLSTATFLLIKLTNYYQADLFFAQGHQASEAGNTTLAYTSLTQAVDLNPNEPFYRSELGYAAASLSVALAGEDASTSAKLQNQAVDTTTKVLATSPKSLSYLRTAVRTYYLLSTIDQNFSQKAIEVMEQAIKLAPTDPKLTYNLAVILGQEGKTEETIEILQQTIKLKQNYREAYLALGQLYFETGQVEKAVEQANIILQLIPNDAEAKEKLQEWGK